jgi:hypothetical protein
MRHHTELCLLLPLTWLAVALAGRGGPIYNSVKSFESKQAWHACSTLQNKHDNAVPSLAAALDMRGGGLFSSSPPSPPPVVVVPSSNTELIKSLCMNVVRASQSIYTNAVIPVLQNPDARVIRPVQQFVLEQAAQAHKRRQQYANHPEWSETTKVVTTPARGVRLALAAWLLSEVLALIQNKEQSILAPLLQRIRPLFRSLQRKTDRAWKQGRAPGGLLRPSTWQHPRRLSSAVQSSIPSKFQWAFGVANGLVISPMIWTVGIATLETLALVYVSAEAYHYARQWLHHKQPQLVIKKEETKSRWGWSYLRKPAPKPDPDWKHHSEHALYTVDKALEGFRHTVRSAVVHPATMWWAIREKWEDTWDEEDEDTLIPPHVQRGFLAGLTFGAITGV